MMAGLVSPTDMLPGCFFQSPFSRMMNVFVYMVMKKKSKAYYLVSKRRVVCLHSHFPMPHLKVNISFVYIERNLMINLESNYD